MPIQPYNLKKTTVIEKKTENFSPGRELSLQRLQRLQRIKNNGRIHEILWNSIVTNKKEKEVI